MTLILFTDDSYTLISSTLGNYPFITKCHKWVSNTWSETCVIYYSKKNQTWSICRMEFCEFCRILRWSLLFLDAKEESSSPKHRSIKSTPFDCTHTSHTMLWFFVVISFILSLLGLATFSGFRFDTNKSLLLNRREANNDFPFDDSRHELDHLEQQPSL